MQKTVPLEMSVLEYINTLDKHKEDALTLLKIFEEETNDEAILWNGNMIGFGSYHYRYDSGHEGVAMKCGFAIRKANITLYLYTQFDYENPDLKDELLSQLGKHTHGRACIYIKKVSDIDAEVLRRLIQRNQVMVASFPSTISF
jgi:hypothetical protein